MKVLGVEFAPISLPMERRLQTMAVLFYASFFFFFGFGGVIVSILLLFTRFYFLPILYLGWFIYDKDKCNRGGRLCRSVRRWRIWKYYRDYFPLTLVKTADLDPNKNYIFGYHPHGILCAGAFGNFCTEATGFSEKFPGITCHLLTLVGNFSFPFHREFVLATGTCAASKESINWLLSREGTGNALVLVIGGAAEALDAHPDSKNVRLTLKKRKGFVRLALKHGASLVPTFTFGENDLYSQVPNPDGSLLRTIQRRLIKYLGFSTPIIHGRGIFQYNLGYLPYRKPITTVIGKPIDVEAIKEPTEEDVAKLQEKYIQGLQELFDEYKVKYGTPDMKLEI